MEDKKSVYIADLHTFFYCCGAYPNGDNQIIGVYSTADKAEKAGQDALLEDFVYDAKTGVFHNESVDEAWVNIIKYSIDIGESTFVKHIPKKRG